MYVVSTKPSTWAISNRTECSHRSLVCCLVTCARFQNESFVDESPFFLCTCTLCVTSQLTATARTFFRRLPINLRNPLIELWKTGFKIQMVSDTSPWTGCCLFAIIAIFGQSVQIFKKFNNRLVVCLLLRVLSVPISVYCCISLFRLPSPHYIITKNSSCIRTLWNNFWSSCD